MKGVQKCKKTYLMATRKITSILFTEQRQKKFVYCSKNTDKRKQDGF